MARSVKVACLQTRPVPSITKAIVEARELAKDAIDSGAEFLFLPEYCGGLKSSSSIFSPPCETEKNHEFLQFACDMAKSQNIWIMVGSIAITGIDNKYYNRGYIIDNYGNISSKYSKIHLFDITLDEKTSYEESSTVIGGGNATVVNTAHGKIGHTICYDLRFPQLYRSLSLEGAEILAVPAAFTKRTGEAHWHILNRARAIENGAYVVAPCAIGSVEGGGAAYGHSLIVDPWGSVIADGGEDRGIIVADIDLDRVAEARARIPSLFNGKEFEINDDKIRVTA